MNNIIEFEKYRKLLFSIAYKMLGSAVEAEDMVQDTYYKWEKFSGNKLDSSKSFLTTIIINLCIDELRSSRKKRETYIGSWLPEPIISEANNPEVINYTEISDSLSTAFLIMLESLSPIERAVYLLHDIFDYNYKEIGKFLNKNEDNCRQIAKRSRDRISDKKYRFTPNENDVERMLDSFLDASVNGNIDSLISLLEDDIILYSDSGGNTRAARKPIFGNLNVAKFILGIHKKFGTDRRYEKCIINGLPGLKINYGETLFGAVSFQYGEKLIEKIFFILNPDKLKGIN